MPRKIAIDTLQKILKDKSPFTENKDSAFVNMLVLTTLRHLVYIKHVLKNLAPKKIKSPFAEHTLYAAIAETLYMDSPDYAIINSYVDLIKAQTDKYIAGFANAVLRKITSQKEEILKQDQGDFFPSEFYKILKPYYNKSTIANIQKAALQEPFTDITVKSDSKTWAQKLGGTVLDDTSIRLPHKIKITSLEGFNEGEWWVQDFAASMAVKTLGDIKGKTALDICAAPGGKTAQFINNGAITTALDISSDRLQKLEENLTRLHLKPHQIICADGLEYLKTTPIQYDIILLDAPCSATGTLRRHPEIVHIKTLKDVEQQAELQKQFLSHINNALKPNGTLIYCVCSISHLEGEKQIEAFLTTHQNFVLEQSIRTLPDGTLASPIKGEEDCLPTCWLSNLVRDTGLDTSTIPLDSFFIAKLKKVSS